MFIGVYFATLGYQVNMEVATFYVNGYIFVYLKTLHFKIIVNCVIVYLRMLHSPSCLQGP